VGMPMIELVYSWHNFATGKSGLTKGNFASMADYWKCLAKWNYEGGTQWKYDATPDMYAYAAQARCFDQVSATVADKD